MSAIEEMLARIAVMGGVEGYVIVDSEGAVLRQSKGMNNETAAKCGMEMMRLTQKARHVVRDLDPSNDLQFFRLKATEREILAAPGEGFLVIVIQNVGQTTA